MCPWVGSHAPSFGRQLWGAAQPCGVSLATGGIAPASLRYDRLTPVARVAGSRCLAGDPLLDCVPARLSSVASTAPGDVCRGPRCSLAGLGPVALEYRSCHWPGGSAGSPQCARPWGCGVLCPAPPLLRFAACACAVSGASWLPFTVVHARCVVLRVRCPGLFGSCVPVWCSPPPPSLFRFYFFLGGGFFCSPLFFFFFCGGVCFFCVSFAFCCLFFFFLKKKKNQFCVQWHAHTTGTGSGSGCSCAVVV